MGEFLQIVFGLLLVFIGIATYMIVRVGTMGDEDRESVGHGPKGQGR